MTAPVIQDWEELRFEAEAFATMIIGPPSLVELRRGSLFPTSPAGEGWSRGDSNP